MTNDNPAALDGLEESAGDSYDIFSDPWQEGNDQAPSMLFDSFLGLSG